MADRTLTVAAPLTLSEATPGETTLGVDLSAYAPLASPALTGTPTAPTATAGTDTTQIATTAFVREALLTTPNAQSGTTYTLVLADAQKLVTCDNAAAVTVTIPPNASVAYPTGTRISFAQLGAGQVTLAPGSGVTLNTGAGGTLKSAEQYAVIEAVKLATDTWLVYGDREAAA